MRGIRQLALCVGVAAAAACGDAELEPLGELVFDRAGEGATQSDSVIVLFGVIADQDFPDSLIEFRVTSTDSGRVIVLGAENAGAAFGVQARRLSDGADQVGYTGVQFEAGGGGSFSMLESAWVAGGLSGENVPDFTGWEIGAFEVHLDRVRILIPGSNPNGNGNWTDYNIHARIVVLGRPAS